MIVATVLSVLGFVLAAWITQTKGLRLGGAILVPTLVVYALKDFETLPVFLVSAAVAYLVLWQARERTLAYGRDEFLVAIGAGALVPVAGFLVLARLYPGFVDVHSSHVRGSDDGTSPGRQSRIDKTSQPNVHLSNSNLDDRTIMQTNVEYPLCM